MPSYFTEPPFNLSTTAEPSINATTEQMGNITTHVPGNETTMPGNFTEPPFNMSTTAQSIINVTTEQPGNITTHVPGNETTVPSNFTEPPYNFTTSVLTGMSTNTTELFNVTTHFPWMATTDASGLPKDETPNFKGKPKKVIRVEVAISEISTKCRPAENATSEYCKALSSYFVKKAKVYYKKINGFQAVRLADEMREGSVVIPHVVVYNYVAMLPQDEDLSAMAVYQRTLGRAVARGRLGNLSLEINCSTCVEPRDETNFCNFTTNGLASCQNPYLELQCIDGYVECRSPCKRAMDYCNDHGECSQADHANPVCRCLNTDSEWYHGDRCQYATGKAGVIASICVVLVSLLIAVCAAVYFYKKRRSRRKRSWNLLHDEDNDNFGDDSDDDVNTFVWMTQDPTTYSCARGDTTLGGDDGKYTCFEMEHP
ncbi:mucin-17-like [Acanthaster planci]|uniref:Mucin-17-like n=1 Tax=Acanthaster planci TaxID=133434 RepID=A0A8B8A7T1_ACAPL|nr:mucin-17-like [Acanthaster planci]